MLLLSVWTKMFLLVLTVLYSFYFRNLDFNQGCLKESLNPFFLLELYFCWSSDFILISPGEACG